MEEMTAFLWSSPRASRRWEKVRVGCMALGLWGRIDQQDTALATFMRS